MKTIVKYYNIVHITAKQPLNESQKCGHNTTMKHMERFKKVLNIALKNEWLKKNPFANFRLSYKKVDRGFLTLEELAKIEEKVIPGNRLQKIRDLRFAAAICFWMLYWNLLHRCHEPNNR